MVCNHRYRYVNSTMGLVDYGGTIVAATCHNFYRCEICGKTRWRIHGDYRVVLKRKDNKNVCKQLQLL